MNMIIFIIRYMPMGLVKLFASIASMFARFFFPVLDKNIENIYHLPCDRGFGLLFKKQLIKHQIICFFETVKIIFAPKKLTIDGLDQFKKLLTEEEVASQKGHLIMTAHLGAWELLGVLAKNFTDLPFYVLAKEPQYNFQKKFLTELRSKMSIQVLWSNKPSFLKQMIHVLKQNIWMIFVMDQKPEKRIGPMVTFFDQTVTFSSGPAACAIREAKPVIAVFCIRKDNFHYELLSKKILSSGHREEDTHLLTQMFATEIEKMIRLYPEQWCWNYKRWKF